MYGEKIYDALLARIALCPHLLEVVRFLSGAVYAAPYLTRLLDLSKFTEGGFLARLIIFISVYFTQPCPLNRRGWLFRLRLNALRGCSTPSRTVLAKAKTSG